MSKNLVFGFTSIKSSLLPLFKNALPYKRTLLNNISKLLCKNSRNFTKSTANCKLSNTGLRDLVKMIVFKIDFEDF